MISAADTPNLFSFVIAKKKPIVVCGGVEYKESNLLDKIKGYKQQFRTFKPRSIIRFPENIDIEFVCALIATFESECVYAPHTFPTEHITYDLYLKKFYKTNSYLKRGEYLVPTSGSEGESKWIVGNLLGLKEYLDVYSKALPFNDDDVFTTFSKPIFDPFLREIFLPLFIGARLVIPENKGLVLEPGKLKGWLNSHQVSVFQSVPTVYRMISGDDSIINHSIHTIMSMGESLYGADIKGMKKQFLGAKRIFNIYGPSETTLSKLLYCVDISDVEKFSPDEQVPVGKPICGAKVLVVDEQTNVCLPNETGELIIRYRYPSYGYLTFKEGQNFDIKPIISDNPFDPMKKDKVYYTGDLVYLDGEGNIVFSSRKGMVIKVRGVKVNLNKIEQVVNQISGVKSSAAVVYYNQQNIAKVALFYTGEVSKEDILTLLKGKLMDIERPSYIECIQNMPLTESNKINRKSLKPILDNGEKADENLDIVEIFALVIPGISFNKESSFLDSGGQSIDAVQIVSMINKCYNVQLKLKDFFDLDSIGDILDHITRLPKTTVLSSCSTPQSVYDKKLPVIGSQSRFINWINNHYSENSSKFQFSCVIKLTGELDRVKLISAIKETVRSSVALNTRLVPEPLHMELINNFDVPVIDIEYSSVTESLDVLLQVLSKKRIDIYTQRPIEFTVLSTEKNTCYLIMNNHVVCSDGTTKTNILHQISKRYNGDYPISLCSYLSYVNQEVEEKKNHKRTLEYWEKQLKDLTPLTIESSKLEVIKSAPTRSLTYVLPKEIVATVNTLCKQRRVSTSSILLNLLETALFELPNVSCSYILVSNAKRYSQEFDSTIGCLTDSYFYPLSSQIMRSVRDTHEKNMELLEQCNMSFESICQKVHPKLDFGSPDMSPIIYSPQPIFENSLTLDGVISEEITVQSPQWIWPIEVYPNISKEEIIININYAECSSVGKLANNLFNTMKKYLTAMS